MDRFLRLERLDAGLSSSEAEDYWIQWYQTFNIFLNSMEALNPNKLDTLINFLSPNVYK